VQGVRFSPDTRRIETRTSARSKIQSRYKENRDKNQCKEQDSVPIQGESRQEPVQGVRFSPDTRRIETRTSARSKIRSRYKENRDKNRCEEQDSVPIQEESGQEQCKEQDSVPIQGESRQEPVRESRSSLSIQGESRQKSSPRRSCVPIQAKPE